MSAPPLRFRADPRRFALGALACLAAACASPAPVPPPPPPVAEAPHARCEDPVFQRASVQKTSYFENETKRLAADLEEAEAAMIAIESGMRSRQTRADAVSVIAEARIAVERVSREVPWRSEDAASARAKLEEAEKQLESDHLGTAIFFASRARRIADTLNEEARRVAANDSTRFIRARRVNLRGGPSKQHPVLDVLDRETPVFPERLQGSWWLVRTLPGQVGWVHASLLR